MKKYKFLFLILFLGLFFIPKDVFAKTTVDYMVIYSPGYEYQNSCDNCQYLDNFAPDKRSDRVGFRFGQSLIQGVTYTMRFTFDVYYSTSSPYYYDFGFYGPSKLGNAGFTRSEPVYVEWMNAYQITNTATLTWTQGQNVENFAAELYFEPNLYLLQLNVVDWTLTAQGQGNSDVIINSSQNIIDNQDKNTDRVIDNQNKNHQEAETTRKGILSTLKNIPNLIIDGIKSLFIPDDNYFSDKFDELTQNVQDVLGFLAYPFTLITRTFEFFLTIEDTGIYLISWDDVKVPNFEEYSIIKAGSFDFATLLADSRIASLRNIAFVFINALLLLAFLQLCHNKYNEVFGGDVSTTEFISVSEEYDIDYKTGEVSNIKHIEKKTTRRDIN